MLMSRGSEISRVSDQSDIIDSILKEAQEDQSWMEKVVEHTTPGGQRRKVKVKSLSPKEQEQYRPKKEDTGDEISPEKKEDLKEKIKEKKKEVEKPEEHHDEFMLYDEPGASEASKAISDKLNSLLEGATEDDAGVIRDKMLNFMEDYSEFGARDTEAEEILTDKINDALGSSANSDDEDDDEDDY